ncbi:hypothetical protein MYAM1_003966 [Malassezia yamatoensis]|uniref:Uncharacterized protein n=1 Tax=Malassezia yamatoensis TaxID=253288 RepID=A0AAJ6CJV5_9BASI|nr:hypothetical protein MYAM1_003966 [Malassezia yamatoensis]
MVTILFESVEEQKKRILPYKKFAITLRRIIQGSRIASEALTSFRDVVFEDGVIKKQAYGSEHQNLFLNFDALPGDCASTRPAEIGGRAA